MSGKHSKILYKNLDNQHNKWVDFGVYMLVMDMIILEYCNN